MRRGREVWRVFDGKDVEAIVGAGLSEAAGKRARDERRYLCALCRTVITSPSAMVEVEGRREHFFANPSGFAFRIACFSTVVGCALVGSETEDFTWFSGFAWTIAVCRGCQAHLGWRYRAPGRSVFYGLILDKLVLTEDHLNLD